MFPMNQMFLMNHSNRLNLKYPKYHLFLKSEMLLKNQQNLRNHLSLMYLMYHLFLMFEIILMNLLNLMNQMYR